MSSPSRLPSPSQARFWRPAAQKNIRNQFSYLFASKERWIKAAAEGRKHATGLVNAFLSQKYMPMRDLCVLKDMPGIREKAIQKLTHEQVCSVSQMVKASRSMRVFLKKSEIGSPIIQFCSHPDVSNDSLADVSDDSGDGGGVPVFSSFSMYDFENYAQEVVDMFILELVLKRLIVVELISIKSEEADESRWLYEMFEGEFDEFEIMNLISEDNFELLPPKIKDFPNDSSFLELSSYSKTESVLQVYLTTWLANVNIKMNWINDIVTMIEEDMGVKFS